MAVTCRRRLRLVEIPLPVWIVTLGIAGSTQTAGVAASGPILMHEEMRRGSMTRVQIELKAQGLFRPGLPPGAASSELRMPKPLELDIQTRLIFGERIVEVKQEARPQLGNEWPADSSPLRGPWIIEGGTARRSGRLRNQW